MVIEQLPASGWPTSETRPLLQVLFSPEELTEKFGLVFVDDEDDLGPLRLAVVKGPFGTAGLIRHTDAPFAGTVVYVDEDSDFEVAHRTVMSEFGLTNSDLGWARRSVGLLEDVQNSARLSELLAVLEFDVSRTEVDGTESIDCGIPLVVLAGDFTGGRFYRCGDFGTEGPVLYASSGGQAGLIADSVREALQLVIGLPHWRDCLNGGHFDVTTDAVRHAQTEAAALLSLDLLAPDVLLNRLRAAVLRSGPEFVFRDETGEYEGL